VRAGIRICRPLGVWHVGDVGAGGWLPNENSVSCPLRI
jgi:hypothetical protein